MAERSRGRRSCLSASRPSSSRSSTSRSVTTPWRTAAASYVSGDYSAAADVYAEIGALPEEAYARLRAAEALVGEGRSAEADAELKRSLAFWRSVGATAYVREGEALLAEAS